MDTIYFKFNRGQAKEYGNNPVGWLAVGDHGVLNGTPLLSPDCVNMEQIEYQAKRLKRFIDDAVLEARTKLPA